MRMNRLGNSDLVVSAVGAGTWAMGGDFFGAIDDKKCIDSLCASLDHGVNLIDTAPIYGKGHSETLVGQAIKGRRDKVVLCTKVGLLFDDPKGRQGKCLQPDSIEYEIEQSLRRLGTDYIDLYQFHLPPVCYRPGDGTGMYECMLEAKRRGMIRHIGLTNHALSVAQDCIDSGLYETLQFPLSYLSGPQELALVEGCRQANMGYIAMKALAGGLILNAAAAAAWMAQFDHVLPIWGIQRERELEEFLAFIDEPPAMTPALEAVIAKDRQELVGDFCRGCGYCMPCPQGIEINQCARMSLMMRRAPAAPYLTAHWQQEMAKISTCLHCGKCAAKCPYHLDTPALLAKNYADYQAILAGEVSVT